MIDQEKLAIEDVNIFDVGLDELKKQEIEKRNKTRDRKNELARLRRAKNPQHERDYKKKWRSTDKIKEKSKLYQREWLSRNREKVKALNRLRYANNRDKFKEDSKKRYAENREERKLKSREYYEKNKEKIKERSKKYYREHHDRCVSRNNAYTEKNRRIIRKRNKELRNSKPGYSWRHQLPSIYGITFADFSNMMINQTGRCLLCGKIFGNNKRLEPTIDHDHDNQTVYGLVHMKCNVGIGFFENDPFLLTCASDYCARTRGVKNETPQAQNIHDGSNTISAEINDKETGENISVRDSISSGEIVPTGICDDI